MIEKGYPHPLYSLDLVPHPAVPEDEPRYAILLPAGRLVVRAELRRRAQDHAVLAVDHLVGTALAYHRLSPLSSAQFGLGPSWADHMTIWRARMLKEDEEIAGIEVDVERATAHLRKRQDAGRALLSHLGLSARLAGLGGLCAERPQRLSSLALLDALRAAAQATSGAIEQALLSQHGCGAAQREELVGLREGIEAALSDKAAADLRVWRLADAVLVMRAALLGDATRLCQVARQVLGPTRCEALRPATLLLRRPRAR